jgi:uncharacterized membrane protein YqiK
LSPIDARQLQCWPRRGEISYLEQRKIVCDWSKKQKAKANDTVELTLKATADSEAKSQRLITSMQKQSEKKIASITHRANKRIESFKMDLEHVQQDCQSKSMAALEADRSIQTMTRAHAQELSSLTSKHKLALSDSQAKLKSQTSQHKIALRDTQARHVLRFDKQKQSMTIEMNQLRELLYGQNEMINGCTEGYCF